jgi:hypothetical protein
MTSKHSVRTAFRAVGSQRRILSIIPVAVLTATVVALAPSLPSGAAQAPIDLQTAGSFAVLAGAGITNTGATTVWGDIGTFPITTEDSVTLHGTDHAGDAVTQQAKNDLTTAYNQAAGSGPPTAVGTELGGGPPLTPGVYNSDTLEITGTLTLDTQGDPYAVFIFQSGATLVTASDSNVTVLNGGIACNVFWQVPSSATLGTDSHLIGTVLAATSIQAQTRATIQGRLLAGTASVTLDTNTITDQVCANAVTTTTTTAGGPATTRAPSLVAPSTPSTGGPTASTPTTGPASGVTTTTSGTGIPGLPVTGSDPRLPLAGVLAVGLGASILRLSNTRRRRGSNTG